MNVVELNVLHVRAGAIRRLFNLPHCAELLMRDVEALDSSTAMAATFSRLQFEWPSASLSPVGM